MIAIYFSFMLEIIVEGLTLESLACTYRLGHTWSHLIGTFALLPDISAKLQFPRNPLTRGKFQMASTAG